MFASIVGGKQRVRCGTPPLDRPPSCSRFKAHPALINTQRPAVQQAVKTRTATMLNLPLELQLLVIEDLGALDIFHVQLVSLKADRILIAISLIET